MQQLASAQTENAASARRRPRPARRDGRSGVTLIPVVIASLLLAGLAVLVQTRADASLATLGRLVDENRRALERAALHELLRREVARAIFAGSARGAPRLDGTPYELDYAGTTFTVSLQDVEGLVDLYLAPPSELAALDLAPRSIEVLRKSIADPVRPATLAQSLARFDLAPTLASHMTQRAARPSVNRAHAPPELRRRLGPGDGDSAEVGTVRVSVGR